jgi:hypothetical protein
MLNSPPIHRILIPHKHWTAFPNRIFDEELRVLKQKSAAAVYLFLIDFAAHRPSRHVVLTRSEIAARINMDERIIKRCLSELEARGFIRQVRPGVLHSHINKDRWLVPAAQSDSLRDGWTPVPRLLIREYLPKYPNAALLPVLLYHQHMHWRNKCWMGVERLSKVLNWSPTRVRSALRTMSVQGNWSKLETSLPRPLSVSSSGTTTKASSTGTAGQRAARHYSVQAVRYTIAQQESKRRVLIPKPFLDHFGIELPDDLKRTLSSIFRYDEQSSPSPKQQKSRGAGR